MSDLLLVGVKAGRPERGPKGADRVHQTVLIAHHVDGDQGLIDPAADMIGPAAQPLAEVGGQAPTSLGSSPAEAPRKSTIQAKDWSE